MSFLLNTVPNGVESYVLPVVSLLFGSLLFFLAPKFFFWISPRTNHPIQVNVFRTVILAFVGLQMVDLLLHQTLAEDYDRLMYKMGGTLLLTFVVIVSFNFLSRVLNEKLGFIKVMDGETVSVASYQSWLASLVLAGVLFIFSLLAVIEVWGFTSLTERTGLIGVTAAFLVLTSNVWFPDIFYGILMLRSLMVEEGDTIRLSGDKSMYIVYRLAPFYCLLLNINTNARVVVKNSHMFKTPIENLTKRAAVEGLRKCIELKLSYPNGNGAETNQQTETLFITFEKAVSAAFERLEDQQNLHVNKNKPFEWQLSETGDYALHFCVYYYLTPVPVTKLTQKVREHLVRTHSGVAHLLYEEFSARNLRLATPILVRTEV